MKTEPYILNEVNLSHAWAKAMLRLLSKEVKEISPLVVNLYLPNELPIETPEIRHVLDEKLRRLNHRSCDMTANTIFPQSMWTPSAGRQALFARYNRALPKLRTKTRNVNGIYFERFIRHGHSFNQLNHIIETWEKGNHRRSALQAVVFDPKEDHTHQRQRGFPCLQQVMFVPDGNELTVSGVYGVQHIFDRAYGNYLGLCRLGHFMAHEMGLRLTRLQCVTTIAKLGKPNKTVLSEFADLLPPLLERDTSPTSSALYTEMPLISTPAPMANLFETAESRNLAAT